MRQWRVWIAFFALAAASSAQAAESDIADLLSVPQPEGLVAAADAPTIAWVSNERGVRNVWVARAPEFAPRKLTAYTEDDGQTLGPLQLSADGRWVAYARGSAPDAGGNSNNPTSDPDGVEQAVWIVASDGAAAPQRLAAGRAAMFAPGGTALIVQGKSVGCFAVPGAKAPAWCIESLLKTRGANSAAAFSPDGTRLAFVSNRGDHNFIGVLDLAQRTVRWLAPDLNRDSAPVWSPDGRRIAFVRIAGSRNDEVFNLGQMMPFEIWTADASSGEGRRLFRSGAKAGGYAQFAVDAPVRWSKDGQVLFSSEENGWLHWYSIPAEGGAAAELSRGDCEAETAALAGDGTLLFSGNCDDIDRRQIFAVAARGGEQKRLTPADAIATDPQAVAGDRWLAFRHADARQPTAIAVMPRAGGEPRRIFPAQLPASFPQDALVEPKAVRFRAADGQELHGQLFLPPARKSGKRPALVYVHGGPIRQMLLGWHPMNYYYADYANNQWLAQQGFVVLALNYRAGTGYGQAFRNAAGQGPRGASEYQDVLAAHEYLSGLAEVDPQRIGIYGGSYGGYLTALALARDSASFAAGVDRHGVHNWKESAKGGDNSGLWGLQPDELDLAFRSSPVASLDGWRSPVLIAHGDDDHAVLFRHSTDLVARLRDRGVAVETLAIPDEDHFFLRYATWVQVHRRTMEFFRRRLGP
ncbi:S9 family peptidase [Luteimonas gilva]|uniref:Acyl-peptide hydrolase n=1 Tax=Luteimonas gilva TaxID=2572684 RepID=A0A4V5ZR50_9GAMM|nr:prolyl oligopeptidase family serine peptidase [Luteimonas gilva]TKR33803.1 S9 family peptidase [Luteimonas gilva]